MAQKSDRRDRLAAALRENLRRRKAGRPAEPVPPAAAPPAGAAAPELAGDGKDAARPGVKHP